jgi:putative MATE family efflux protein
MLFRKDVMNLALPVMVEQFCILIMGFLNSIIASSLGKEVVSAIGMIDSFNIVIIYAFSGLAIGGTVLVAQFYGRKERNLSNESGKQILYVGTFVSIFITIIIGYYEHTILYFLYNEAEPRVMENAITFWKITIFTYPFIAIELIISGIFRGVGNTKLPMLINIIMNMLNILLSYTFIYGIQMHIQEYSFGFTGLGIVGAALGIGISRIIGGLLAVAFYAHGTGFLKIGNPFSFRPNLDLLKKIFSVGIPAAIEALLFNGGKIITQIYIVSLGTEAIAANYIAIYISAMLNIPGNALGVVATTMVAQYIGKRNIAKAKETVIYILKLSTVCLTIFSLACIPFYPEIILLYTRDLVITKMVLDLLIMNSAFMIVWAISFVLPAGLKGAGDATYTMIISLLGMWIFRIFGGYLFGIKLGFGIEGVWMGMFVDWLFRGSLYIKRLVGTAWYKHNIC